MLALPKVIIAGDEPFYYILQEKFPLSICDLIFCDTLATALSRSTDADLIVVDYNLPGGGEELCKRLRADPITAVIPVVLRSSKVTPSDLANHVIPAENIERTMRVMCHLCPRLANPPKEGLVSFDPDNEEPVFDVEQSTVVWRRDESIPHISDSWPQPPPKTDNIQDPALFTTTFTGYVNSLVEGYRERKKLSSKELRRLETYSAQVVNQTENFLSITQSAVNDTLKRGDLKVMRELSAARNVLYEKLKVLSSFVDQPPKKADISKAEKPAQSLTQPPLKIPSDPSLISTGPQPKAIPQKKSELTLAAEKLKSQRAKEKKILVKKHVRKRKISSTARKTPTNFPVWIWVAIVGGCIALLIALLVFSPSSPTSNEATHDNISPKMIEITMQQTPAGIIAYPKAHDQDGNSVSFSVRWLVDGQTVPDARSLRLAPKYYDIGRTIEVEITPDDGYGQGTPMRSQPLTITQKVETGGVSRPTVK